MFNLPPDKEGHIRLGLLIGMAFATYPFLALVLVILVAIGKEAYDYISSKYFHLEHNADFMDLIATVFGGLIGIVVPVFIYAFLSNYVF
jgi:hypothetical protein